MEKVLKYPPTEDENKNEMKASTGVGRRNQLGVWVALFFVVACCGLLFIYTKEFSVTLTLAAVTRCVGFAILLYHMARNGSATGVSWKMLQMYLLTFVCRLTSILRHQGYLPIDKSGDWMYHAVEMCSLLCVGAAMGAMAGPLAPTYDARLDAFGSTRGLGVGWCVFPCLALAAFFHPTLNKDGVSDICWALSMYLEAVAMLPQIYLFHRQIGAAGAAGTIVQPLIGHTVFAVGFSRLFELAFWCGSYRELTDGTGSPWPGFLLLFSQAAHLFVVADFGAAYVYHTLLLSQPVHLLAGLPHHCSSV